MSSKDRSVMERMASLSTHKAKVLKRLLEEKSRHTQVLRYHPRSMGVTRMLPSWAQQRLWFIDQLEGGSLAYHIGVSVRLRGRLDRTCLQDALDALLQRHEALRTVLVAVAGEPQQEIRPASHFMLRTFDLRGYGDAQRDPQLDRHEIEDRVPAFDLTAGPLVRGRLIQLGDDDHVLFLTMHHIVSDGWSMGVMIRELATLYEASAQDRTSPLAPLPIQYADYAQWQREEVHTANLQKQLGYWQERLANAPPQLDLPTDRPRPSRQTHRGGNVRFSLTLQRSNEVRALGRRHHMTLFMLLYASWAILMARLSGQCDVVVGTPVANRQRPEFEDLIGFFVNTLPLRINVQLSLTLREFLEQAKALILSDFAHQDVPFERIVEIIQPERSLGRNPIFQSMLALQNAPKESLTLPNLDVTLDYRLNDHALFDLLLSVEDREDGLHGILNYATALFDRDTMERWLRCWVELLGAMAAANEDAQVGELSILSTVDWRMVVEEFNTTATPRAHERSIHRLFEQQVERAPQAVAIRYGGQALTYEALNRKANQLARSLKERGADVEQVVAVCVERSIEMVVTLLAVLKSGAGYLPLDPNYPPARLQQMVDDAAPTLLISQHQWLTTLERVGGERIWLEDVWEGLATRSEANLSNEAPALHPQSLLYLIYTSGSTGQPKGTAMSHGAMVNLIEWHRKHLQITSGERVMQFAALSFDVAFQETFSTLCLGGTLVLLEEWIRRDPRALAEFLDSQLIGRAFLPPIILQSLAEQSEGAPRLPCHLRDIIVAGEQLRITPEIQRFFSQLHGCRLHNHYGPTETHVVTALTLRGDANLWPVLPTIGQPIDNTQIYILDERLRPQPAGVVGEVYIGGQNVARGYWQHADRTVQRFLPDPLAAHSGARMYRTGDIGRWQADGTIEYLGRNDHQVKIRGFRIELGDIEAQLTHHPSVKAAVVIAREDVPGEKRLVAYVTANDAMAPTPQGLRDHLKGVLPDHMVPSAYVAMDMMPVTPSGKLDRRALPAPGSNHVVMSEFEAPIGDVEERVAGIWREILHIDRVGRHDNFFGLGGHSLHGMKLIARITERFGLAVSVLVVFQHPTVKQMAHALNELEARSAADDYDAVDVNDEVAAPNMPGLEHPTLAQAPHYPLAFSQLAYWHLNRLGERPSLRQVAFAMRVRGRLHLSALRRSADDIVRRHSALRTRFVMVEGVPMQEVRAQIDWHLDVTDLTGHPEASRQAQLEALIGRYVTQPVDVSSDPLFGVALFRVASDEHVLVVATEHLISDAFSVQLFLYELLRGYRWQVRGQRSEVAALPLQFCDHAVAERRNEQRWLDEHGAHWRTKLAGLDDVRLPGDIDPAEANTLPGWATIALHINAALTARLRAWARRHNTTLVLSMCAAYVALLHRYGHGRDVLMQFQTSGRTREPMEYAIGFFASVLYLRVGIRPEDRFEDVLNRVAQEYYDAYAHADGYYFAAQVPRHAFTRTCLFNWVPLGPRIDLSELAAPEDQLDLSPASFSNSAVDLLDWDSDPMTVMFETDTAIVGGLNYPRNRFSASSMAQFARHLVTFLQVMVSEPETRVSTIMLTD